MGQHQHLQLPISTCCYPYHCPAVYARFYYTKMKGLLHGQSEKNSVVHPWRLPGSDPEPLDSAPLAGR